MAKIHVTREHQIGLNAARAEVERIAQRIQDEYGADYCWEGDTLEFSRPGVSGHIVVTDNSIDLTIKLGLLLAPMKHQIEERIVAKIDRALDAHHADDGDSKA
jgi:putative polyhydroxyalkanoate system protein